MNPKDHKEIEATPKIIEHVESSHEETVVAPKREWNATVEFQPLGEWYQQSVNMMIGALVLDLFCWFMAYFMSLGTTAPPPFRNEPPYLLALITYFFGAGMLVKTFGIAHDNLEVGGIRGLRFNGRAVIWSWFVPLLNLFMPLLAVQEILRGSDIRVEDLDEQPSRRIEPRLMHWWLATLFGYLCCWLPSLVSFFTPPFDLHKLTLWPVPTTSFLLVFWLVVYASRIYALVQLRSILREIAHRQMHKFGMDPDFPSNETSAIRRR